MSMTICPRSAGFKEHNVKYDFSTGFGLVKRCEDEGIPISEVMLRRETEIGELTREKAVAEMRTSLKVMRESVKKGLKEKMQSVSRLSGGEAM